ncbi:MULTISPECIES: response regulator transcription factor [unclassified Fusibacter]|uniref:response regulator transcription factor n=1 Tax=unclassified Fusibacter TaxID=2624464 RepID=UPI0010115AB9|nr:MULTISPECIES: response regulator transcription factor [unclassified Fusibacter]MCK8060382.1 response regulator transcription factor [Fusibacter sp. A2]NPE20329.1 response regulator transcription factor [Fusibacter sp. A1]RXV63535.1 DNA-binding response regulator [Fusibacter sp. A1]
MAKLIYVADDEKNIRELMKSFLKNAGFEVATFETGDLLYEAFLKKEPDMIVLDLMMPGTDGLTICTRVRSSSPVPIIIVSARDSELDRITGITIGSDDYLVKPFSPIELVARVNSIFRRISLSGSSEVQTTLNFANMVIDEKTRQITYKNTVFDVSPTEFDFLAYLFNNQDKAVSREELLKNVWQFEDVVDTRATDDVVKRLRKKLAPTGVRITAVWGFGFKLETSDEKTENT